MTVLMSITTSCWSRHELDTLAIVKAVGIDKVEEDGKLNLTFQIVKPSQMQGSSQSSSTDSSSKGVWVLTSTGYTVFDAVRNATMQSDRRIFLSQNKIIVIGEELARQGISPILDFFNRDGEPRRLSWLLVSRGKASDIINAQHEQEMIPAQAIDGLIESSHLTSMGVKVNLNDFFKNLSNPTSDPVACRIELIEGKDSKSQMRCTGASVFKEDRLVGFLDEKETRGLNWILGNVKGGIIVVKSPIEENKNIAFEIIRANSKIIPEIQGGQITITVEINEEGNLGEQMSNVELTKPGMLTELEKRKAEVISKEIQGVLKRAQREWGVDIFGFGKAVHSKYPMEWKELKSKWQQDVLPEINVRVKVNAQIRSEELSSAPTTAR